MDTNNSSTLNKPIRKDILQAKQRMGIIYGIVAGLSFSLSCWGWDAYTLSQVHMIHPWLKLMVAIVFCVPVGGITGWLASRLDKAFYSMLVWLVAGAFFAWLSVANTFQIYPFLLGKLNPEILPWQNYSIGDTLKVNGIMAYVWMSIFWSLIGLIQVPLLEQATFSLSSFSKLAPLAVCTALVLVGGLFIDNLNNEVFRSSVVALDKSVQFVIDTSGQTVDRELSRKMHATAVRAVEEWLDRPRYYFIGGFDDELTFITVMANFGGDVAKCTVVYNQTSFCEPVSQ